jgi:hypothetical protein
MTSVGAAAPTASHTSIWICGAAWADAAVITVAAMTAAADKFRIFSLPVQECGLVIEAALDEREIRNHRANSMFNDKSMCYRVSKSGVAAMCKLSRQNR